jgi:DNA-binding transcriptional LysR family regulator
VAIAITVAVNTFVPLISLTENCVGIACVSDFAIREQIATGLLVSILDGYIELRHAFFIAWPSSRHLLAKLRVFVEFLPQRMSRLTPPPEHMAE